MATTVTQIYKDNNIIPDSGLVASKEMARGFGLPEDYVELHVSDPLGKNLYSVVPFKSYRLPAASNSNQTVNSLIFDPSADLTNLGINQGNYVTQYNILRPKVYLGYDRVLFIKEISSDRKEIRLSTNNISNTDIENNTVSFITELQSLGYFREFYINLGNNVLFPAVNIALDKNTNPYSIVIKLLNPLPSSVALKTLVSIVDEVSNPQAFKVNITLDAIPVTYPTLRSANFDLDIDDERIGSSPYYNFNNVSTFTNNSASLQIQRLLGVLSGSNFSLNVDYTDYNNFVHFSSAARRLEGFSYKLGQIELFTSASASAATNTSNPTSLTDASNYQAKINKIVQGFDGYDRFLYYESSSYAWPKVNNTKPYVNYPSTSSQGIIWYNSQSLSASNYDDNNQNYLLYAVPGYVNENTDNEELFKFIAVTGQMFDDVWLYIKGITDLYKAKNALNDGISKDLVFYALQSLGIKLYNDQDQVTALNYIYGINDNGSYLPLSSSYETMVTASQYGMSGQDIQKSIYKRIYANLPLLLKSKGTNRFIQFLNTIYGVPNTILSPIEYGGADKLTSSFEYEYDRFTYALNTSGSGTVRTKWTGSNNTIEFRFKPNVSATYPLSQSLLQVNAFNTSSYLTSSNDIAFGIGLYYTASSGFSKGHFVTSLTGSSVNIHSASYDYGYLTLYMSSSAGIESASNAVYPLPIFTTGSNNDTRWWNVSLVKTGSEFRLNISNDSDSDPNNFSSVTLYTFLGSNLWNPSYNAGLTLGGANSNGIIAPNGTVFNGQFQELRFWSSSLTPITLRNHLENPSSIEGATTSSAYNELTARFPLGNNLLTYNHSLTSSVYSTQPNQSTIYTASFFGFPNKNNYTSFVETYYANTAVSAYSNPVTDKIRIVTETTTGSVLLPNKSIVVPSLISTTKDIHLLDSGLSIQDEIDKDIIAQFGSTYNVDDILGNPRQTKDQYYAAFSALRSEYFKKYTKPFSYREFIHLVEYFHNSLFKTLKDFLPAKTNVATGIVVKPHLLDKNIFYKYNPTSNASNNFSQSIAVESIDAGNGGDYSASLYNKTVQGNLGLVTNTSDARDFFTGELTGSVLDLNDTFYEKNPFTTYNDVLTTPYSQSIWNVDYNPLLNNVTGSQISTIKKKLEIQESNARVTSSVSLQDFYYDYTRHIRPRYDGSTTTSTLYNFHSDLDEGILSVNRGLGQAATIDKHTFKYAFLSEAILSGSDNLAMPERTNLYIKYLIDPSGSLTELTKRNYDTLNDYQKQELYQVQRMFPKNETVNVSLFDSQTPSKQQLLDGNHNIFAGGFKYHSVLWNRTGATSFTYTLSKPKLVSVTTTTPGSGGGTSSYSPSDFSVYPDTTYSDYNYSVIRFEVMSNVGSLTQDTSITVQINYTPQYGYMQTILAYVDISTGQFKAYGGAYVGYQSTPVNVNSATVIGVSLKGGGSPSPGGTSTYNTYTSTITDTAPFLKVHLSSSNVLIASPQMSTYYPGAISGSYTSDGFLFGGDGSSPSYDANYPFVVNPGDLIRLYSTASSNNGFSILEEYEIAQVFPPTNTYPSLSFSLNRNINLGTIDYLGGTNSTTGSITHYIINRKIPDETNIVIDFQKQGGQTAAGIVKNVNLDDDVNNNIANVVSELKSKIFSTVLVQ